ncbi:tRNA:m4X modification enzyme [Tieghemiomyces parasiticus]|uniref:tRNA:m(4)X modification enzyme TRM13 n=1 Tax=Tieghemiomyces parasiticus TaxID=78921 RepID=A0A9W7ZQR6_9FUNG|nr:tRNA:m4X modification enzyme [Tieghemiomyces parasiticus]
MTTPTDPRAPMAASPVPPPTKKAKVRPPRPPSPSSPGRCHYFLKQRNKYCGLCAKIGRRYCGEHSLFENIAPSNPATGDSDPNTTIASASAVVQLTRVPCPLDPSHTVNIKDLERHMKFKCNSRPPPRPLEYFKEDYNVAIPPARTPEAAGIDPQLLYGATAETVVTDRGPVRLAYKKRSKHYDHLIQNQLGRGLTLTTAETPTVPVNINESISAMASPVEKDEAADSLAIPTVLSPKDTMKPFADLEWSELREIADRFEATYHQALGRYCAALDAVPVPTPKNDTPTAVTDKVDFDFPVAVLNHQALDGQRAKKTWVKHVVQQASLLGHLERLDLLRPEYHFVEFGAGKGELTKFVQPALLHNRHHNDAHANAAGVSDSADSTTLARPIFTLVDRRNFRNKFDKNVGGIDAGIVQRIQIDIKDLDLCGVPHALDRPVVAYSKHLCGAATDITLRCLDQFVRDGGRVAGIVIALCCHHACIHSMYVNQPYLVSSAIGGEGEDKGIDVERFARLASMSSWAICGKKITNVPAQASGLVAGEAALPTGRAANDPDYIPEDRRETIGRYCKRIFDLGRAEYLRQLGYRTEMLYYVEPTASPENLVLAAVPVDQATSDV